MLFRYTEYPDGVLRPVVPVTLHGPVRSRQFGMLIDSGADVSVISGRTANFLGLELTGRKTEDFQLADGSRVLAISIEINATIADRTILLQLAVIDLPPGTISPLLGQRGFFDQFEVRFRRSHEEFEILPATA